MALTSETSLDDRQDWARLRIQMCLDSYYDREFFTNLINCMDRKKTPRDIFELAVAIARETGPQTPETDRALFHLFYCYQASSFLRESYQWLPIFQGAYALALQRGTPKHPVEDNTDPMIEARGSTVEEFRELIKREARRVNSYEHAWGALQFLSENRSLRIKTIEALIQQALKESDALTTGLLFKAIDVSFASGWKKNSILLRRAFERFWNQGLENEVGNLYRAGAALSRASDFEIKVSGGAQWAESFAEDLWHRISRQSAEAAWEFIRRLGSEGASFDQIEAALHLMRGRCLFAMKTPQWPSVSESLEVAGALQSATRWIPTDRYLHLAMNVADLVRLAQSTAVEVPSRPDGRSLEEKFSENTVKNQLILRMDDAAERGDRHHALDLLAIIVREVGLTHSLSDRLVLMAAKQDAWTYGMSSIPVAMELAHAFQEGHRAKLPQSLTRDAAFGLLRFLCDQREASLKKSRDRNDYGDGGLSKSPFDVSGGARIVDRFVFNQVRNAQRIKIWPTEGKG